MRKIVTLILLLTLFAIPTLAQDDENNDGVLIEVAPLTSISIDDTDGIEITIEGELLDACTELGEITQSVEDDVITITVTTTRPADAMCAMVISAFEDVYTLDTSELEAGDYTLNVNDLTEDITLIASADAESVEATAEPEATESVEVTEEPEVVEMTCPEANDDLTLFDDFDMCFLYPSEFDVFAGSDFVFISQPLTSNAVLLIQIEDANDTTLDDIREQLIDEDTIVYDIEIANQESLVFERGISREAYFIVNEQVYQFVLEPFADETAGALWAESVGSLFFPEPEDD